MCLEIDMNTITAPKKRVMWKVVLKNMRSIRYTENKKYKIGRWYKSNRTSKELSCYERASRLVNKGIHVYTTREEARRNNQYCTLLKVEVDPSDWVASGRYDEAVYIKVKPVSIVR